MPDIVLFDGPNRIITVIDDVGNLEMELDVVEIYSEWKVWCQANSGDNLRYLPAFSFVGGDPISATQSLGITYFLENGWRVRPAEKNHKLTIIGNLFTREEGESVFLPTLGSFTVNTETRVSNLVDSSVSRLDLNQLLTAVYIDQLSGEAGTDEGSGSQPAIGTPTRPSNNLADAFTIANRDNLSSFIISGSFTLDRNVTNWRFGSAGSSVNSSLNLNGFSADGCLFEDMTLSGILGEGSITCDQCVLAVIQGLDGIFRRCGMTSSFSLDDDANAHFESCVSRVPGNGTPVITCGTNVSFGFRNYSGGIRIEQMTAGCSGSVDLDPGHCILDSSCTGGDIVVRGTGNFTDESGAVNVVDLGLLESVTAHSALLYRDETQQLDVSAWLERAGDVTTPTSMQLDVYDMSGVAPILTIDQTHPAITLTPAGWYAGTVSATLQQQTIYFAMISVGDARGIITRTRAAIRA